MFLSGQIRIQTLLLYQRDADKKCANLNGAYQGRRGYPLGGGGGKSSREKKLGFRAPPHHLLGKPQKNNCLPGGHTGLTPGA